MSTKHLTVSSLFFILTLSSLVYFLYSTTTAQAQIDGNSVVPASTTRPDGDVNRDGREDIFDLLDLLKYLGGGGNPNHVTDINQDSKTNIFDLLELLKVLSGFYESYLIKGQHFDNYTEQGVKALLTINGREFFTYSNGIFSRRIPKESEYIVTARQIDENGNFTGYKRTIEIPGMDIDTLEIYSVSYPTTVTPETFRAFLEEGNTWGEENNEDKTLGIIKFYDEGNMKYVIIQHSFLGEQYYLNSTQQDFIESVIREKIFDVLGFEIPIEKKDVSYIPPPIPEKGNILIGGGDGFSISRTIENNTIIEAAISLHIDYISDRALDQIMAECASAIYMPWEVGMSQPSVIDRNKSIFHYTSQLPGLQEADIKAYKLCKRFRRQHIDNVLGLE